VRSGGDRSGSNVKTSVFAGVGKTEAEIKLALESGIFAFHVESEPELARINHVAGKVGVKAPIAIRVNPDVDAHTHAKITTGKSDNKFGIPLKYARRRPYEAAAKYPNIAIKGVQMHIGSQLTSVAPFVEAGDEGRAVRGRAEEEVWHQLFLHRGRDGHQLQGRARQRTAGLVGRAAGRPAGRSRRETYGAALVPLLKPLGLKVLLEHGRFMVGNAGVLLARVEHLKRGAGKKLPDRRRGDERPDSSRDV